MHTNERTFDRTVEEFLHDAFPDSRIDYQVTFEETRRRADFVVERDMGPDAEPMIYVVETEDDFAGLIKSVGQVLLYAAHFDYAVPIIAIPEDHFRQPEFEMLREQASMIRFVEVPEQ